MCNNAGNLVMWPKCLTRGNWSGPGYSGGEFQHDPRCVRWYVKGIDRLDRWCRVHDWYYQHGKNRRKADWMLATGAMKCPVKGIWNNIYRDSIIVAFGLSGLIYKVFG